MGAFLGPFSRGGPTRSPQGIHLTHRSGGTVSLLPYSGIPTPRAQSLPGARTGGRRPVRAREDGRRPCSEDVERCKGKNETGRPSVSRRVGVRGSSEVKQEERSTQNRDPVYRKAKKKVRRNTKTFDEGQRVLGTREVCICVCVVYLCVCPTGPTVSTRVKGPRPRPSGRRPRETDTVREVNSWPGHQGSGQGTESETEPRRLRPCRVGHGPE